jgi:hypothetical protein
MQSRLLILAIAREIASALERQGELKHQVLDWSERVTSVVLVPTGSVEDCRVMETRLCRLVAEAMACLTDPSDEED